MPFQNQPDMTTPPTSRTTPTVVGGPGWRAVRLLALTLCLTLGGPDAGGPVFAAFEPATAAVDSSSAGARPLAAARFAMTPAARSTLQALWRSSVRANEERVACLGGARGEDGMVRITRVRPLPAPADSANASAAPSLATCRPPRWFGTVHTHIITNAAGEPYIDFSTPDRDVMSRWEQAWRAEGVFCLLYSGADAHCVAGARPSAIVTYAPPSSSPSYGVTVRTVVLDR